MEVDGYDVPLTENLESSFVGYGKGQPGLLFPSSLPIIPEEEIRTSAALSS
jgi:hypothetical protein